jgi:hypothetical protein
MCDENNYQVRYIVKYLSKQNQNDLDMSKDLQNLFYIPVNYSPSIKVRRQKIKQLHHFNEEQSQTNNIKP